MVGHLQASSLSSLIARILQGHVFERESSPDVLRQLPGQGGVDRKVQKLVHHGRTGILPAQDLLLERAKTRLTRTLPRPYASKEEREEPEQPRSTLRREWSERGGAGRRPVSFCAAMSRSLFVLPRPFHLTTLSSDCVRFSVLHIAPILAATQS